jgi:LEA14-like dessication related protein
VFIVKKIYLPIAVLMIAILLSTLACAPSELKPCTVELGYVSNEWAGEEVVAANVFLTIKNPNSVPVSLDSLNYSMVVSKTEVGMKTLVPGVLIPANGSIGLSNTVLIDYSSSLAVQKIYIGQGKDYVTAHVMAAPLWKLLGGKKPPLWDYPAIGVFSKLKGGATVDDIKAGKADMAAVVTLYATLRGTVDAVQGALDKVWEASPAGPCDYQVTGKAGISYGSMTKDTSFDLKYTRK